MKFLTLHLYIIDGKPYIRLVETDIFFHYMSPGVRYSMDILSLRNVLNKYFGYKNEFPFFFSEAKPKLFMATNDCNEKWVKQQQFLTTVIDIEIPTDVRQFDNLFSAIGKYMVNGRFDHFQFSSHSILDELVADNDKSVLEQCSQFNEYKDGRGKFSFDWYIEDAKVAKEDKASVLPKTLKSHLENYTLLDEASASTALLELTNQFLHLTCQDTSFADTHIAAGKSILLHSKHNIPLHDCLTPYMQLKASTSIEAILLNSETAKAEKLRYLFELHSLFIQSNHACDFKEVLSWIVGEIMHKHYLERLKNKVDADMQEYGTRHSEYRFLIAANFIVMQDGRLCIDVTSNPEYKRSYDKKGQLEKEFRFFAKWLDFEFDHDCDFTNTITFTHDCSEALMKLGLHLNATFFFEQKSKMNFGLHRSPPLVHKQISNAAEPSLEMN